MTRFTHFRQLCYSMLLLAMTFFLATSCYAISMQVQVGFDGVQKSRVWTPVAVQLANTGDDNIDGVLMISKPQGFPNEIPMCTAAVSLPAHSNKLYHSYVRLPDYGSEITVALTRGNSVLALRKASINPASENDKLIISVGDRSSRLGFLQGETMKIPPRVDRYGNNTGSSEATINAGSISQSMLPDRPAAYDGVNILVVSDITPASTNPNALKALGMWVASGGTLVISTGADYRRYTDDFYKELLPVTVTGAANLPKLNSLLSFAKQPFPASAITVAKSAVKPGTGKVLASEGGVPIIAERRYGVGRVIFLAFDYKSAPFRDWNGQNDFWKSILKMPVQSPFVMPNGLYEYDEQGGYDYDPQEAAAHSLEWVVAQRPSVKTPSFNTIGGFLLIYLVVLVPANYFFLKRKRRLELAWITTPMIVIVFSVGAYTIGYTMKGSSLQLNEAVLIEGSSNARFARAMASASLFSPARRSYNVSVSDPMAVAQAIRPEEREILPITTLAERSVISDVNMAMWSSKNFEDMSGVDLGGTIDSNLMLVGNKIRGKITNNTSLSFIDCKVVYAGNIVNIGKLTPGTSADIDIPYKSSAHTNVYPNDANTHISNKLYNFTKNKSENTGIPMLIATPETGNAVFDLPDNQPSTQRASLYVFHLDYSIGSGTFKLTPDMVNGKIIESNNINLLQSSGFPCVQFYGKGYFIASYNLPVQMSADVTITSLKLEGSNDTPGSAIDLSNVEAQGISVEIYNYHSNRWDSVVIGRGKVISPTAEYIGSENEVRVKVKSSGKVSSLNAGISVSVEGRRL